MDTFIDLSKLKILEETVDPNTVHILVVKTDGASIAHFSGIVNQKDIASIKKTI
jgi:hypothetical protein